MDILVESKWRSQRDYGEKLDFLGVSIQYDIWVRMGWNGGVTKYLVGRGGKKDVSGPGWTPAQPRTCTCTTQVRQVYVWCWALPDGTFHFQQPEVTPDVISQFRTKMLARHASGAQLILSSYFYPPHQRPQYLTYTPPP